MKQQPYVNTFLSQLTPGEWYPIASIPRVIGFIGLIHAAREQILLPDYEIIIGRLFSTYKIIRTTHKIINNPHQIPKAI